MPFTPQQKAEFDRLELSGYLPQLREWIKNNTVSFFWHDTNGEILHNGTLSLVSTGSETLGITAEHVYSQYLADLEAGRVFECQFGGVLVRPERLLTDSDRTLDVATFRMPELLLSQGTSFHESLVWPPPPFQRGEWLFYGGYPKAHRQPKDTTIESGLENLFGKVEDISGTKALLKLDFSDLHWPLHLGQSINEELGGSSGGPAFRVIETGLTRLEFVGTVMEHAVEMEGVFIRSASVIRADGTLER